MSVANKAILFDSGKPDLFDGSMEFYDSDAFFPGTFASFQPGHPEHGIQGAITSGMTIKNAARRNAGKMLGVSEANLSTLDFTLTLGSDVGADRFKLELTPMGGLHQIIAQALGSANTHYHIRLPDALKQHIFDFSTLGTLPTRDTDVNHPYGVLVWQTPTRLYRTDSGKTGNAIIQHALHPPGNIAGVPTFGSIAAGQQGASYPITGVEDTATTAAAYTTDAARIGTMGYPQIIPQVGVPQMRWIISRGWFNALPANIAAFEGTLHGAGPQPGQNAAGFQQSAMSMVTYRVDMIDMALYGYPRGEAFRGHTGIGYQHGFCDMYGQRDLAQAAFMRAFAPGGIHYNDTLPTAPGSIP